ncbi:SDR family oxidoreductase [Rhodopirellula bahusiensis]|uniref:SDR family oxidoreductase n=1 Tax=Rhodopirellula bahusiensis TaxID=2014065 RepID=UPI0032664DB5
MYSKCAVITGATGDIGNAIARRLSQENYFVLASGRRSDAGRLLADEIGTDRCCFISADVCDENDVSALFSHECIAGREVDLVVISSGVLQMGSVLNLTLESWREQVGTNLCGCFLVVRRAIQRMIKQNSGTVIIIGSRWGASGAKGAAAYSASKAALRGFCKSVQCDLLGSNVRCMLVSPGSVRSSMSDSVNSDIEMQLLSPDDVAGLVVFLSSTPQHVVFDEVIVKASPFDFVT